MKTWQFEMFVVALALSATVIATGAPLIEWLAAAGVLFSFAHGQVSDRLAEKEASREKPGVDCYRWSLGYFLSKEIAWCAYFIARGAWAALVGCGLFLAYPLWRRWYRRQCKEMGA